MHAAIGHLTTSPSRTSRALGTDLIGLEPAGQQATASQSVTNCSQGMKTGFFSSTVHDSSAIQVPCAVHLAQL